MSAFSGNYRHLISIQVRGSTRDEAFQPIETWTEFAAPWADILNTGGMEAIRAGAVSSKVQTSIRLRYRTDIDASMRVVHGTNTYKILAVLPDERRRQHVDLVCEKVANVQV